MICRYPVPKIPRSISSVYVMLSSDLSLDQTLFFPLNSSSLGEHLVETTYLVDLRILDLLICTGSDFSPHVISHMHIFPQVAPHISQDVVYSTLQRVMFEAVLAFPR